jgi:hypothetical protein
LGLMRDLFKFRPPPKGFGSQLVLVLLFVGLMTTAIYVGSFVSHFLWILGTEKPVHSAEDAPAWLAIPSFIIGYGLFFLIARRFRFVERFVKACQK